MKLGIVHPMVHPMGCPVATPMQHARGDRMPQSSAREVEYPMDIPLWDVSWDNCVMSQISYD